MIGRKTAALISASAHLGALLGGADLNIQDAYRNFGHFLGLAFQVQDDYLGIWGDTHTMGKSSHSDLINGKKSLPILFGISNNGQFAKRWHAGGISECEVSQLSDLLSEEGGRIYTLKTIDHMMDKAMKNLLTANPGGEAGEVLKETAINLLGRKA